MDATAMLVRLCREPRALNHLDARHSVMPAYRHLFDVRKIERAPSPGALVVGSEFAPSPDMVSAPKSSALVRQLYFWPTRLALCYLPFPRWLTVAGYHAGHAIMRLGRNRWGGDYKAIFAVRP